MTERAPYGILAEFDAPEPLVAAVRAARAAGFEAVDAFTPFPVDGLAEATGFTERRIPKIALIGGIAGAAIGYGMQVATNLAYPIDIGGRPLLPPQAFGLITFELTVLGAVVSMIVALFVLCRLPRLHHPLFEVERFERATVDGFFLLLPLRDTVNDRDSARDFLLGQDPRSIVEVEP